MKLEYDSRQHVNKTIISNRLRKYDVNRPRISAVANTIKQLLGIDHYELHLAFVGSRTIRHLNQQFRAKDRSTDVLSFPQQEWAKPLRVGHSPPRRGSRSIPIPELLGDVVISLPDAERNAKHIGQGLDREVCFLMIHGILHLCGHDHQEAADERRMLNAQREIFEHLGKKTSSPPWRACVRLKQ